MFAGHSQYFKPKIWSFDSLLSSQHCANIDYIRVFPINEPHLDKNLLKTSKTLQAIYSQCLHGVCREYWHLKMFVISQMPCIHWLCKGLKALFTSMLVVCMQMLENVCTLKKTGNIGTVSVTTISVGMFALFYINKIDFLNNYTNHSLLTSAYTAQTVDISMLPVFTNIFQSQSTHIPITRYNLYILNVCICLHNKFNSNQTKKC